MTCLESESQCAHQVHRDPILLGCHSLYPMHGRRVVADEGDMGVSKGGTHGLHYEPKW